MTALENIVASVTGSSLSPFGRVRFEHDGEHLYHLPPDFNNLERESSIFLVGSRGTGKTTLLEALSWRERVDNPHLRSQLGDDPLSGKYLGLYFKLPGTQIDQLHRWLAGVDSPTAAELFILYLDSVWLQLACDAVADLLARGRFTASPEVEESVIRTAVQNAAVAGPDSSYLEPTDYTVQSLLRLNHRLQNDIETAAVLRAPANETLARLPHRGVGSWGRALGTALTRLCGTDPSERWRFIVCMDEGEALSEEQQIAVNSAIRLAESNVLFVVSYVSQPAELVKTINPALTLQRADVHIEYRDRLSRPKLRELLEGIVAARVRANLGVAGRVRLNAILGETNLNQLLDDALSRSERREEVRKLYQEANDLRQVLGKTYANIDAPPPIWQAYALRRLATPLPSEDPKALRRFTSANLRGKIVGSAYLGVFALLGARPRYAGADIMLALSDNCVRDGLWNLDAMLRLLRRPGDPGWGPALERMTDGPLSRELQDNAFRAASDGKLANIESRLVQSPDRGRRLVVSLCEITKSLQQAALQRDRLDAEPGWFSLHLDGSPSSTDAAKLLLDTAEAGYIRLDQKSEAKWSFRVHNALAPHFELSYRGGYRHTSVTHEQILRMATAQAHDQRAVVSEFARGKDGPDLFTLSDSEVDAKDDLALFDDVDGLLGGDSKGSSR